MGFGKPPSGFSSLVLEEGVLVPAMVNSHTHIELSWMKGLLKGGHGVHDMAKEMRGLQPPSAAEKRRLALSALKEARSQGTWFYTDTSNDPDFPGFLRDSVYFEGKNYFEILGFSSERSAERIAAARKIMKEDNFLLPTIHSPYGSSPSIMKFVREHERDNSISIHLFEASEESMLPMERGRTYRFLQEIGQYERHDEMFQKPLLDYLFEQGMLSFKKILLAHLTYAGVSEIELLSKHIPHAAWVLTQRSNEFLGQNRKNWNELLNSPLTLLLGTDSLATAPDLSILNEMLRIRERDFISKERLWKAATYDAYNYLEIHPSRIPWFFFAGAKPDLSSMEAAEKIFVLRD